MIFSATNLSLNVHSAFSETRVLHLIFKRADGDLNVFDQQTLEQFAEVTEVLEQQQAELLIVSSEANGFFAGADVKQFSALFNEGEQALLENLAQCNDAFTRFSRLPFPSLAVINDFAMGGGLELALCCDFRMMGQAAKIGLPEVKLGIIPGFGGTVRMPRLVGVDNAVEWVCGGRDFKADKALADGVVDAVVADDQLASSSVVFAQRIMAGDFDWQKNRKQRQSKLLLDDIEMQMAFTTTRGLVASQASPHMPAPLTAHKAMKKHAALDVDEAIKVESELFASLATGAVSRALIGLYLNEKQLGKGFLAADAVPAKQLAVIGAGIMGGGIAYQAADKGVKVCLKDISEDALQLGLDEAGKLWGKKVAKGRLSAEAAVEKMRLVSAVSEPARFDEAEIIVEAVVENKKIKQQVLAEAEKHIPQHSILCSNTSTIEISQLAEKLSRPENFCGMHFFNPVHRMLLVEVIRGENTSEKAIAKAVQFVDQIGKKPIVVNDCPGFYVNRVLFPYLAAFNQLVNDGLDYRYIDSVMEAMGWPMGPAYLLDVVGIDTACHASAVMAEAFPERMSADFESAINKLFAKQRLGQKNAEGFYRYETNAKGREEKVNCDEAFTLIYPDGAHQDIAEQDIIDRLMFAMLFEVVRCLDEDVVSDLASAELGLVMGIGFPLHLGGPLRFFDEMLRDPETLMQRISNVSGSHPLFEVPASLLQRIEQRKGFYQQEAKS